jgi:hypothetical protein
MGSWVICAGVESGGAVKFSAECSAGLESRGIAPVTGILLEAVELLCNWKAVFDCWPRCIGCVLLSNGGATQPEATKYLWRW